MEKGKNENPLNSKTLIQIESFEHPKNFLKLQINNPVWKVSKYRVISGLYFPVFRLNTGKYGQEITRYLETFHAV